MKTTQMLATCAWCDRVHVDDRWVDAGQIIRHLRTFEHPTVPTFVQTICGTCERRREAKRASVPVLLEQGARL
jgi:hypothetical protein